VLRHVEANQHLAITEPKTSATTAATGQ